MGADAAWIAFGSAIGGAIAGGIATFWGTVVVNRHQAIVDARTRLYRDVLPPMLSLNFRALTTLPESYEPHVAIVYREANLCQRADRRLAQELVQASSNLARTVDRARQNSPDRFKVLDKDRIELDSAASEMNAAVARLDEHLRKSLK